MLSGALKLADAQGILRTNPAAAVSAFGLGETALKWPAVAY